MLMKTYILSPTYWTRESYCPRHPSSATRSSLHFAERASNPFRKETAKCPEPHRHGPSSLLPRPSTDKSRLSPTQLPRKAPTQRAKGSRKPSSPSSPRCLRPANGSSPPRGREDRITGPRRPGLPRSAGPAPAPPTHFSPAPPPSIPSPPLLRSASSVSRPPRWPRWTSWAPWPGRAGPGGVGLRSSLHASGAAAPLPRRDTAELSAPLPGTRARGREVGTGGRCAHAQCGAGAGAAVIPGRGCRPACGAHTPRPPVPAVRVGSPPPVRVGRLPSGAPLPRSPESPAG